MTEDPSLAAALRAASKARPGLSDAALLKELAMIGAGIVADGSADPSLARILAIPGARPPTRSLDQALAEVSGRQSMSSEEVDRVLEEERSERF